MLLLFEGGWGKYAHALARITGVFVVLDEQHHSNHRSTKHFTNPTPNIASHAIERNSTFNLANALLTALAFSGRQPQTLHRRFRPKVKGCFPHSPPNIERHDVCGFLGGGGGE